MKKYLLITMVIIFANIDNVYANLINKNNYFIDLGFQSTNANHKYLSRIAHSINPQNYSTQDRDREGLNLALGYRANIENIFATAEIFYDDLNSKSKDFYFYNNDDLKSDSSNELIIKDRYGIKLGAGSNLAIIDKLIGRKNLFERVDIFANLALAQVRYAIYLPTISNSSYDKSQIKTSPIYGIGAIFHINDKWSMKLGYDIQRAEFRYLDNGYYDKTKITTKRLSLSYSF